MPSAFEYHRDIVGAVLHIPKTHTHSPDELINPIVTKTSNYSITSSDYTILADGTSNAVVIGIPSASGITGKIYN